MSQQPNNDLEQAFWGMIFSMAWWVWLVIVSLWVLSKWLTRLLFDKVVNPLTDGLLDRHDGLAVALAGSLWSVVFMGLFWWLIYPEIRYHPSQEKIQAFWVCVGLGFAWGVSIGGWILMEWWSEQQLTLEPVYQPVQMVGEPVKLVAALPTNGSSPRLEQPGYPTKEALADELEEVYANEKKSALIGG